MSESENRELEGYEPFLQAMLKGEDLKPEVMGVKRWHHMDVGHHAGRLELELQRLGEKLKNAVGGAEPESVAFRFLEITLPQLEKIAEEIREKK